MNRPFGAIDVAANLKGAVPKTATQKILVALAEKGELTQKLYGKSGLSIIDAFTTQFRVCFDYHHQERQLSSSQIKQRWKLCLPKNLPS